MGIESQQTSVRASIQEHLNTLRARVYRNTLIATLKNYPGSHMEETHITLFNIANPSQGKGKVGAGGANVRGKTEDDEDSNVERNAGVGGGAAAGTAFLRAAAAAAAAAAGETAGASQSVGRPIGGGSGQQVGEYKPQGQRGMSKAEQATNQDILNSAAVIAGAKPMAWAADHLESFGRAPTAKEIAAASASGKVDKVWNGLDEKAKGLAQAKVMATLDPTKYGADVARGASVWSAKYVRDTELAAQRGTSGALSPIRAEVVTTLRSLQAANAAAKADLTVANELATRIQNGIDFMKRRANLTDTEINPEDLGVDGTQRIQGPKRLSGATEEMKVAQKIVVDAAQKRFDATKANLETAKAEGVAKIRDASRSLTADRKQTSLAPNIKAYEAQLNTPNTTYWRQYISPWRQSTAKTAESAGLSFLQDHFRNLETGTSGKKTYRNTTQENLDTLWKMVNTDREGRGKMTIEAQGTARKDMIDFIVKTFGAPIKKIEKYKELSNFQFFYKVLREINAASAILKSYKNRRSVNNIGNVVKQNMARYFRI